MANPKRKPRLKQSSHNFPVLLPAPTISTPMSEFANSRIGKDISQEVILKKYTTILKRKGNKGITLNDLDALQLELETLLLATIKFKKMLIDECSVLEKELKISDLEIVPFEKNPQITCNPVQNECIAKITNGCIKFVIPRSNTLAPVPKKKRKLNSKKDNLATPLPLQLTAQKSPEKITRELNVGMDKTTNPEVGHNLSCEMKSVRSDKNTSPVNSSCSDGLVQGNILKEDLDLAAANNLNANVQKLNLKEDKKKRATKAGKSGGITNSRYARYRPAGRRNTDPSKKYWQSVRSICHTISDPDVKALEDLLKNQEKIEKKFKPSAAGQLFATQWAEKELNEEKVAASETPVPRKPTGLLSDDVCNLIKRAEKPIERHESAECEGSDILYNELLTSLIDEKIVLKTEEVNKPVTVIQPVLEEETLSDFENAIRLDLASQGIISNENIVRADGKQETDIDIEIKIAENKLRTLTKWNITELSRIVKVAKLEVCKQNLTRQLINKGKEIEKAYQSILAHKKKGEPTKKHIKKALKLVKERDIINSKLKDLIKT